MRHATPSPLAGTRQRIKTAANEIGGAEIVVEDWADRAMGGSWMHMNGNPACIRYAMRTSFGDFPIPNDDEVVYGKIGMGGFLVHVSELELPRTHAGCHLDTDGDGNCPVHPMWCPDFKSETQGTWKPEGREKR